MLSIIADMMMTANMRIGSSLTPPGATPPARGVTTLIPIFSEPKEAMMRNILSKLRPSASQKPKTPIYSPRANRRDSATQAPLIRTLW